MRPLLNGGTLGGEMGNLEVRAFRWRRTAAFGVLYALGLQLFYLFRRGHFEPESMFVVGGCVVIFCIFGPSDRYHLRIVDGVLSGPPPRGLRRVEIPIAALDLERSAKSSLFGGRTVWSRTGEAIYIDPITVPREGRVRILQAIGLTAP